MDTALAYESISATQYCAEFTFLQPQSANKSKSTISIKSGILDAVQGTAASTVLAYGFAAVTQ